MLPSAHIWQVFLFWRSFCKTKAWLRYELGANPRLERRRNTINTLFTTDWESSETPADQSTWGQCSTALRSYTMLINLRSRLWRWALKNQCFTTQCGAQSLWVHWTRAALITRGTCMCFNWCFSSVCLQIVTVKQQNKRRPSVCSSADSEADDLLPVLIDHSQILNEQHLEQVSVLLWNDSMKYASHALMKWIHCVLRYAWLIMCICDAAELKYVTLEHKSSHK